MAQSIVARAKGSLFLQESFGRWVADIDFLAQLAQSVLEPHASVQEEEALCIYLQASRMILQKSLLRHKQSE